MIERFDYKKLKPRVQKVVVEGLNVIKIRGPIGPEGKEGKPGKNYILTFKDKKEIASKVKVPVVEKVIEKRTEVVKETPIYKETIKEVALKDSKEIREKVDSIVKEISKIENIEKTIEDIKSIEKIIEKINELPDDPDKQIDFKHIKNFPWEVIGEGIKRSGGDNALVNWGSDLNNFETPSGTIDGVNATFTVIHKPKAIILNQGIYFENDGYTLSDYTITMLIVPVIGSVLRSMY